MSPAIADNGDDPTPTTTPTLIATVNVPGTGLTISSVQPNIISNLTSTEIVITGSGFVTSSRSR
jgi:hypothetical protein